jgi:hypothetical protein
MDYEGYLATVGTGGRALGAFPGECLPKTVKLYETEIAPDDLLVAEFKAGYQWLYPANVARPSS